MITEMVIKYIFSRLQEASTIRGLISFIGGLLGYSFSSNTTENLVYIILGIIGFIGALLPDKLIKKETPIKEEISNETIEDATIEDATIEESEKQIGWNDSSTIIKPSVIVQRKPTKLQIPNKVQPKSAFSREQKQPNKEPINEFSGFNDK